MKFSKQFITTAVIIVALATIIGLSGLNFLIPSKTQTDADKTQTDAESQRKPALINVNKIFLKTKDNLKIAANVYSADNPVGWIVFVHMMPAIKESWDDFARDLGDLGYASIAIDLRGHGESEGGPDGYEKFANEEHQKSINDVESAADYILKGKVFPADRMILVGASVGANLALNYLSSHPEIKTAILLSPGLSYRGIKTEPAVKKLIAGQKVFFAASRDDDDKNNVLENQKLYNSAPEGVVRQIKIYNTAGHGSIMLDNEPELKKLIINFIK